MTFFCVYEATKILWTCEAMLTRDLGKHVKAEACLRHEEPQSVAIPQ